MADKNINLKDPPGIQSSVSLADEDDASQTNVSNQNEATESSTGRSQISQKPNVLKGYHSVDLSSVPISSTDSSIRMVRDQLRLLGCTIKGKSASADEMTKRMPRGQSSGSDGAKTSTGGTNDDFRGVPPFERVTRILAKGRICRSNKISPEFPTRRLSEVITFSPVVTSDQPLCRSAGSSPRKRSSLLNNNCTDTSDKAETCVNVHQNVSTDSMENICRICHEAPSSEKLIQPCLCKGSMGKVHRTCLERWLGESGKNLCEICGQEYNTMRVPKYTGFRSFCEWIRNPLSATDTRNFFFDLACFFILTPLAGLSAWLCILGAQSTTFDDQKTHRHRNTTHHRGSSRDISNSTWTSVGLLSLTGTLVTAYYIWIFIAVRYHLQIWREWQTRNYIVTIQPLANGDFSRPPKRAARPSPPGPNARNANHDSDSEDEFRIEHPEPGARRHPLVNHRHPAFRNGEVNNNNAGSPGSSNTNGPACTLSGYNLLDDRAVMHQVLVESLMEENVNLTPSDVALWLQVLRNRPECEDNITEDTLISLATMRSMEEKSSNANVNHVDTSDSIPCENPSSPTCNVSVEEHGHTRCPRCTPFAANQQRKPQATNDSNTDNANANSNPPTRLNENDCNISTEFPDGSSAVEINYTNNDSGIISEENNAEISSCNETSETIPLKKSNS